MERYTYTGAEGKHQHFRKSDDGKEEYAFLKPGDVVELTPEQAVAFRDRFTKEAAETEETTDETDS